MARVDLPSAIAQLEEAAFSSAPIERVPPLMVGLVSEFLGASCAALLEKRGDGTWRLSVAHGLPAGAVEQLRAPRPLEELRPELRRRAEFPAWTDIQLDDEAGHERLLIVGWSGEKTLTSVVPALATSFRLAWARVAWAREQRRRVSSKELVELGRAVADGLGLPMLYRKAVETAIVGSGTHQAWIFGVGETGEVPGLELRQTGRTAARPVAPDPDHTFRMAAEFAMRAHRRRAPVSERDGERWFTAIPITTQKPYGALVVVREPENGTPANLLDHSDLMRLHACANYLASAQDVTAMLAAQQRSLRELVLLNDVARDCANLGLDRLIPAVCERICRSVPVEAVGLYFSDTERRELVWGGGHLLRGGIPALRSRVGFDSPSIAARAFLSRHARRSGLEEVASVEMRQFLEDHGLSHVGAIPLTVKDRVVGVLLVARRDPGVTDEQMRLLDAIGAEMAVALDNSLLYAEATRRAEDLAGVQEIGEVMARSLDPDLIVRETGLKLCRALDSDGISIYARRSRGFEALWRHGLVPPRTPGLPVSDLDPTMVKVLSTSEPVDIPPTALEEPGHPFVSAAGIGRVAVAPLLGTEVRDGQRRIIHTGAILIGRRATRSYVASELRILGAVAAQLAVAIDNAQLYEQTRRRAEDLALAAEASRALQEGTPPETALAPVVQQLAQYLRVDACAIVLMEPLSRELRLVASSTLFDPSSVPLDAGGLVARSIRERTPQLAPQPWILALPMSSGGQSLGALILSDSGGARALSPMERDERARAMGDQLASAIERAELHSRLRKSLQDLDQAQAQLVRRERLAALGELAALVAHEVRNPLGVIISSLGTLTKITQLDGDARRIYEIMVQESGRLDRIVSDMLDYTRPTVLQVAPGSLGSAVRDAVDSATSSERARGTAVDGVHVTVRTVDLPQVPMDDRLLHQAFVNLLSNAFQSVPKDGRIDIDISLSPDERTAQVAVSDNGPGIALEVRQRLFEPFFTTKAKGSGLGLAMVKRIIDGHGGEIVVETEPGAGTRFVVRLPLGPVSDGAPKGA